MHLPLITALSTCKQFPLPSFLGLGEPPARWRRTRTLVSPFAFPRRGGLAPPQRRCHRDLAGLTAAASSLVDWPCAQHQLQPAGQLGFGVLPPHVADFWSCPGVSVNSVGTSLHMPRAGQGGSPGATGRGHWASSMNEKSPASPAGRSLRSRYGQVGSPKALLLGLHTVPSLSLRGRALAVCVLVFSSDTSCAGAGHPGGLLVRRRDFCKDPHLQSGPHSKVLGRMSTCELGTRSHPHLRLHVPTSS